MNINILYKIKGDKVGKFAIIKKLVEIDKECNHDDTLRLKLEPWVERMNKVKPTRKEEALKMAKELIDEYERLKKEINDNIRSGYDETVRGVSKIEQTNER
jgi:hypothetical protein